MKILITVRELSHHGGVVSYYNSVLPYLEIMSNINIRLFTLGSRASSKKRLHPISDQLEFKKLINRGNFDIVHVNPSLGFKSFVRDGLIIWQAKRKKIPVLVFFRGWNEAFEKYMHTYMKWFFNATFLNADKFIVLSSEFKHKLINLGVTSDIILSNTVVNDELIKDFCIDDRIDKLKRYKGLNILFISRVSKAKGIYETLEAIKILLSANYNVYLSIAGDGSDIEDVKNYVNNNNTLNYRVSFLGYVSGSEKIKAFNDHDIFCLPSFHGEGMPNAVLEAMAFGLPVITTPVGGLNDFFIEGKMGFYVNKKSAENITESIKRLYNDKQLLVNICNFNHKYAKQNFLASRAAQKLYSIYKSMIKSYE